MPNAHQERLSELIRIISEAVQNDSVTIQPERLNRWGVDLAVTLSHLSDEIARRKQAYVVVLLEKRRQEKSKADADVAAQVTPEWMAHEGLRVAHASGLEVLKVLKKLMDLSRDERYSSRY